MTYEDVKELKLSIGDMLSLSCALFDAYKHNMEHSFPNTAAQISGLHDRIRAQCDHLTDAADAELTDRAEARSA